MRLTAKKTYVAFGCQTHGCRGEARINLHDLDVEDQPIKCRVCGQPVVLENRTQLAAAALVAHSALCILDTELNRHLGLARVDFFGGRLAMHAGESQKPS